MYAVGAVTEQDHDHGRHLAAFISRTVNPHEQNCVGFRNILDR